MSRLEEIKNRAKEGYLSVVGISVEGTEQLEKDLSWLIEQAERALKNAQDLEDMDRQLYSEQQQNKRYREAITKARAYLEEEIPIIDCARNAHYTLSKALEVSE